MKPGRELDKRIWSEVMGNDPGNFIEGQGIAEGLKNGEWLRLVSPYYSTNIAEAWEVVDKMIEDGWEVSEAGYSKSTRKWDFTFSNGVAFDGPLCDTAPHAICLAALKAVGREVE